MAERTPETVEEIRALREHDLIAFIRETISQLEATAERLEQYAREHDAIEPGFEVSFQSGNNNESESQDGS